MSADLYLVASAALCFAMLLTGSILRNRWWTPAGVLKAIGNREEAPSREGLVGRADRAGANMVENLVLFVAVLVAADRAGMDGEGVDRGAALFFWARVAYWPSYLLGLIGVRTACWSVGVAGMALIAWEVLRAA
jgi:uncharacterized MAPEG superfamily protein